MTSYWWTLGPGNSVGPRNSEGTSLGMQSWLFATWSQGPFESTADSKVSESGRREKIPENSISAMKLMSLAGVVLIGWCPLLTISI